MGGGEDNGEGEGVGGPWGSGGWLIPPLLYILPSP